MLMSYVKVKEKDNMKLHSHKWVEWDSICDDWGGMKKAEVCLKCLSIRQQNHWGKWLNYGTLTCKVTIELIRQYYPIR